jgi:hypothetical protein
MRGQSARATVAPTRGEQLGQQSELHLVLVHPDLEMHSLRDILTDRRTDHRSISLNIWSTSFP